MPSPDRPTPPTLAEELAFSGWRLFPWLVTITLGFTAFVVWTLSAGSAIVLLYAGWRIWMGLMRQDPTPRRWENPASLAVVVWCAGFRLISLLGAGVRYVSADPKPPPTPANTVRLVILTHPTAVPAILSAAHIFTDLARRRFLAPGKKELTPLLKIPAMAGGLMLPIDRAAGEDAAAAIERATNALPLSGATTAIFPEGHRVTRRRLPRSESRARERGLTPLRHHLEPHPRGAFAMIRALMARGEAEGLRLQVLFGRHEADRSGWGERLGMVHMFGTTVTVSYEDVTEAACAAAGDLATFAGWLRGHFEAVDESMETSPLLERGG